jgi:chaperonin cofactor prefoldin
MLKGDEKVYKLVGPVLMSVDLDESRENVGKRLEFIETEIKKIDSAIGKLFWCSLFCTLFMYIIYYSRQAG